jgi:hypothetical protein
LLVILSGAKDLLLIPEITKSEILPSGDEIGQRAGLGMTDYPCPEGVLLPVILRSAFACHPERSEGSALDSGITKSRSSPPGMRSVREQASG